LQAAYFITQVTYQRQPWLCREIGRHALRTAINQVRETRPFAIDAFVLLPDHVHCLWTLPQNDSDLSTRLHLIKTYVTRHYGTQLGLDMNISDSRRKRKERNLWQRLQGTGSWQSLAVTFESRRRNPSPWSKWGGEILSFEV
jgi:putative transposase